MERKQTNPPSASAATAGGRPPRTETAVRVVLFSGGSGSAVLSGELVADERIDLTVAINGYDDGASTGAVRHALGDCLGPSDFRKNAARIARHTASCPSWLIDLLDYRVPPDIAPAAGPGHVRQQLEAVPASIAPVRAALERFLADVADRPFDWGDCSLGNLVFAGTFLERGRDFNQAVAGYCVLLGLPSDMLLNVTTGTPAWLVAVDDSGRVLGSEAEIVDASRRHRVDDIYLLGEALDDGARQEVEAAPAGDRGRLLTERVTTVSPNPQLLAAIGAADLVVYAPGTQHSSLFPSYLTPGIGDAIAANVGAVKVLVTNIHEDAEIHGSSAVELIGRALHYLREKGQRPHPAPSLITHYLLNDPEQPDGELDYVPLGRLDTIIDPRLVRIADYEEGRSGRHDARKVLTPFIASILTRRRPVRVAVVLQGSESLDRLSQSILELLRAPLAGDTVELSVLFASPETFPPSFLDVLPFAVTNVGSRQGFVDAIESEELDYVVLFDSSGRYRGEDIANVVALLTNGRLDAVWGSRRLSPRDIQTSYRQRYRHSPVLGAMSYFGSHLLSLLSLALYARYVSDTLCGVLAVRAQRLRDMIAAGDDPLVGHQVLAWLLRQRADFLETPVQYFASTPERGPSTPMQQGLGALRALAGRRLRRKPR